MENSAKKRKHIETTNPGEDNSFNFRKEKRHKMADLSPACMAQITGHFDSKTKEIKDDFMLHLGEVKKQVDTNSENIDLIKKSIERLERNRGIDSSDFSSNPNLKNKAGATEKHERYWTSRNSLRIWAVAGSTQEELKTNVVEFIYTVLQVPRTEKIEERILTTRRSRTAFSSKIKNEVIVNFDSTST